jgi:adenylylsulfate kinase-like enzyme
VIILFCGIPGSGKTTIARVLAQRARELGPVQLLSSDQLKPPVYKKILAAVAGARNPSHLLILDATFFKKEHRRQVKILAQTEDVITVYIECSLKLAIERNQARQPNIAAKAVHIMARRMEPPTNPTVKIDSANTSATEAAERIFAVIKCQTVAKFSRTP